MLLLQCCFSASNEAATARVLAAFTQATFAAAAPKAFPLSAPINRGSFRTMPMTPARFFSEA